jgi:sec-independent protein translocase protein TatA
MFDLSPIQLIIVLVIAVLVLGPSKLPEFSRAVGKGIRDLKDTLSGDRHDDPVPAPAPTPAAQAAPVTTATAGVPEEPTASADVLEGVVVSGDAPPAERPPATG